MCKAIEEQSICFICTTYQRKHNGSIFLTIECCTEQLEQTQILPMAKCTGKQQKLLQVSSKLMEEQFTCFIGIT